MGVSRFSELAKAQIGERKNVVISKNVDGTVFIAQQLVFSEGEITKSIYLKNAINVDLKGLKEIEKAIKKAIDVLEN